MLPPLDFKIDIFEQELAAEGLAELLHGEHIVPALFPGGEADAHVRPGFRGLFQHVHLLQELLPALGPADGLLRIVGAQPLYDLLLVPDLPLLVQIGGHGGGPQLLLLHGIVGIIPGKDRGPGLVDLDDLGGNPVQEIAVMGDDDDRAPVVHQIGLQPGDGVHVQVVGGLVQDNQVGLLQEELAQGHPGLLTAGEGADRLPEL